jgi:hypothetical protein
VVVLGFVAVGLARSARLGIPFRDPGGEFLVGPVLRTLGIFVALVALDGLLRSGRPWSLRRAWSCARRRWSRRRLALAGVALLAYHLTYFTYHNLKSWDVFNVPRDALLTSWDRWLFLGHSPAVVLHHLLGQHLAAWVLVAWYQAFGAVVAVAFPAAVALAGRMRDAYVGIAAFVWVWILGTATYYAIPSLGPFHARPGDFAGLPHTVVQTSQARLIAQRDHLLAHPHASDAFAQVSAFASLHVGVTTVVLGLAWWHRLRRTCVALTVFLAGTMVATVYLGWHFAVDLPAGVAIGVLAWVLGPLTVRGGLHGAFTRPARDRSPAEEPPRRHAVPRGRALGCITPASDTRSSWPTGPTAPRPTAPDPTAPDPTDVRSATPTGRWRTSSRRRSTASWRRARSG